MEALYLLCSIASTTATSVLLSLLLPLRALFECLFSSPSHPNAISFYQGHVRHVRRRPVSHAFQYDVRYALLDLDRSPASSFSAHLSAQEARRVTGTTGPVYLLTVPPSVGYEQNPLSVYYCYDLQGSTTSLKKCIAEVTNTPWGERVSFVFNPDSDIVAKTLHVSPFMDMLGNWKMQANAPGENLSVEILVQHPELGDYFAATLKAKRVQPSWAFSQAFFFWLMPQKVALWIYWQAFKLWWKNVSFLSHPKYANPAYREDALILDWKLQCPGIVKEGGSIHVDSGNKNQSLVIDGNSGRRWCVWRDARWPLS